MNHASVHPVEVGFRRGDFREVQDGSGDSFFDCLLDTLGIPRDDEIDEVNLEVATYLCSE